MKVIIRGLLSLFLLSCLSKNSFAQVKWEIQAGINYSNVSAKAPNGNKAGTTPVAGIYLGVGPAVYLADQFAIQPKLVYARRGFKQDKPSGIIGQSENFKAKVTYFELPVDFIYSPKIGSSNLLLAIGPYFGYGAGGKWVSSGKILVDDIITDGRGDVMFKDDNFSNSYTTSYIYAKAFDYGVHLKLGYTLFSTYSLSFEMQQGIANLQPKSKDHKSENTVRNRSWGITVGHTF